MKHLLNGVAIAAALAIAAPVWAQAPMKSSAPTAPKAAAAPAAPAAGAPAAPTAAKQRHKRGGTRRMAKRGPAESTTDQLNRQELTRIQGGPGAGAAPAPPMSSSTTPASIGSPKQP